MAQEAMNDNAVYDSFGLVGQGPYPAHMTEIIDIDLTLRGQPLH